MKANMILKDLLTGIDGESHDLGRWSWVCSALGVTALAAWNAMHSLTVDVMQLANSYAIIAGAHGVALFAKKDTEPKAP